MHIEELRTYCLRKAGVTESFPFDEVTLVFKVSGKMFAIVPLDELELSFTVKCPVDKAVELREEFTCVTPGYHMNQTMWNTVHVDGSVQDDLLYSWIDLSYEEVVKKLTKKERLALLGNAGQVE